jgi:hypothetical protein
MNSDNLVLNAKVNKNCKEMKYKDEKESTKQTENY